MSSSQYTPASRPADQSCPPQSSPFHVAARREQRRIRRLTDDELARELGYWRRRVALAPEEAPGGAVEEWGLFCHLALLRYEQEEHDRQRAAERGVERTHGAGRVPEAVVAEVKRRTDLADLIARWGLTDLRRAGAAWVGRCPFHDDRTPSFYVYTADPDDQHYHCHGCLAHGDVFDLARQHAGWLSFPEAVEGLASTCGVDWPPAEPAPLERPSFGARAAGLRGSHGR